MWHLREMVATLALVWLASGASATRNLTEFCADLSQSMASTREIYTNPQVAMKEALRKVRTWSNVGKDSRFKLARAWEIVVNEAPCTSRSAHHASIIALCAPHEHTKMNTLAEAVRKYTDKCLTSDFWDRQLKKALGGRFGTADKTGLSSFMDDKFIEQYGKDNPKEDGLSYADGTIEDCCRPWRSHKSLFAALEPILGEKSPGQKQVSLLNDRVQLKNALAKHLFKPCHNFLFAVHGVIDKALSVAKYYSKGSDCFIADLSLDFRNAIFKYKYCMPFLFLDTPSAKLNRINF